MAETIYPGFIVDQLAKWARSRASDPMQEGDITVDGHQANGSYGVHQVRVRVKNDPTVYRVLVAPANAPIVIAGRPVDEHFSMPLGSDY